DSRNNEGYFNIYNVDYVRVTRIELEPVTVYTLSGFTTRFLLRKSNYTTFSLGAKFYSTMQIRNVTYLDYNQVINYYVVNNTVYLYAPGGVIRVSNDSIVVPLVFVHGSYVYVINRFTYDPDLKKYTFTFYEVYEIIEEPHVVIAGENDRYLIKMYLVKVPRDSAPPPPIRYFNSLFASYDYVPGTGYVLTLKFSTDMGTFDYYIDLSRLLFYGLRLVNITSINNLNLDDVIKHNLKVIDAIISTVSFYYYVETTDPQVFIASQTKFLEINAPVNTTSFVIRIEKSRCKTR
ncbi:MAG: hypothetical protein QW607_06725, partial [Desulfurococcaceae archaeon]